MRLTAAGRTARDLSTTLVLGCFLAACGGSTSEPPPAVATVEVSPSTASPQVGQNVQLSATVKDASGNILNGQTVSWSSSASAVASVSTSGLVTAHALGTAIITAASGSRSGVATITVSPEPIASISVAPTSDTLLVSETTQLTATMRDASNNVVTNRQVSWVSTNPNIATVSGSGLVTGVSDGVATISATVDTKTATATIRVLSPCSIALAPTITVGQTINGSLATTDCRLDDGTFADGYAIQVTTSTNVQVDLTGSFDTFLILLELVTADSLAIRGVNDDIDPNNTNSRLVATLSPGAQYFILVNSFDPNTVGSYQLNVAAVTFVAGQAVAGQALAAKPGKAPVASLLKALRRR